MEVESFNCENFAFALNLNGLNGCPAIHCEVARTGLKCLKCIKKSMKLKVALEPQEEGGYTVYVSSLHSTYLRRKL